MADVGTLGDWKRRTGQQAPVPVKVEMRRNLLRKLEAGATLFPGILGYDASVVPQVVNAILSRHNMILLGLRGQAKSRLLRSLTTLLDPEIAAVAGCEIHDDPLKPLCQRCRALLKERGDDTPVTVLTPDGRYVEKLATPDVTIADIIGDVDPIRAARGGHDLGSELTMHYGLLPRAHRGHLRPQRAARPRRTHPGRPVQHPPGGRRPDQGLPGAAAPRRVHGVHGQPRGLHRPRQDHHPAEGPHRQRDPHPLPGHHRAGRGHHPAGGVDGPRAGDPGAALHPRGRGGHRLRRPPRQEDRQAQRGEPAPAHQRARERDQQRGAARAGAQGAGGGAARLRRLRRAALPHRQVRAGVRGRAHGRGQRRPRADPRLGGRRVLGLPRLRRTCGRWWRTSRAGAR